MANLSFTPQVRPAWWVLAAGVSVTLVAEVRRRMRGTPSRGRSPAVA